MSIYDAIIEPDEQGIARAADALNQGGLVAFPTETVYGLGADARNDKAVAAIFETKNRPQFNPLIVHVPDLASAECYGVFSGKARKLAQAFWPGALTVVVGRRQDCTLSLLVSAGLDTIALRAPDHQVAQQLLKAFGGPIAAPSANLSGGISPTEAEHVAEGFGEKSPLIIDGGACEKGIESTIIGFEDDDPVMLRPGGVPRHDIEELLGCKLKTHTPQSTPNSPGQLESHYAPRASLRLNASDAQEGEMFLAFGPGGPAKVPGMNLSLSGNLQEAAANLFAYLRMLDDTGCRQIAVMPIPADGLGEAINDRLKRAAAPRD